MCMHNFRHSGNEAPGYDELFSGDAFIQHKLQQVQKEDKLLLLNYKHSKQQMILNLRVKVMLLSLYHPEMTRK